MTPAPLYPPARGGHATVVKRPKLPAAGAAPKAGSAGWKSYTEARWNKNHPYAGQEGVDPITGEPKMPSSQEIRAKANAEAWKSIQKMQSALPSEQQLSAQYGGQRQDIANLVDAHRAWLEKAGEYQVSMSNGLAQMAQVAAGAGDQGVQGSAALAGAAPGSLPTTNVAPTAVGMPVSALGTSAANYLHSLVPYATAQGSEAMTRVNNAQNTALDDLRTARQKISAGLPELQLADFKDRYGLAVEQYKSELAALVQGQKGGVDAAKFAETQRHNRANELTAARNSDISEEKAQNVMKANSEKLKGMTAGERTSLQSFFKAAADIYKDKGGSKAPGLFSQTIYMKHPTGPGLPKLPTDSHVFTGDSIASIQRQRAAYIKANPGKSLGPIPAATWTWDKAPERGKSDGTLTGKYGEATRRLKAWRYLVAQNENLGAHKLSESDLRARFREMFGAPAGS